MLHATTQHMYIYKERMGCCLLDLESGKYSVITSDLDNYLLTFIVTHLIYNHNIEQ